MRVSTIIAACATSILLMGCAADPPQNPQPRNPQDFPPYLANQPTTRTTTDTNGPATNQQMHAPTQPTPMERAHSMY
jgi:hypothetical protein